MELPAHDLEDALMIATQKLALALGCEKVDAFLLEPNTQTLRAVGTSDTPLGRLQRKLGLHILPLANGGGVAEVFRTGVSYLEAHTDQNPNELRGIVGELGVRSALGVALEIDGERRGVLAAVSQRSEFFQPSDLTFLEFVARWMGMLAHRLVLAEQVRKVQSEHERRAAADELITVLAHDLRNHLHPLLSRLHLMCLHVTKGELVQLRDVEMALRSVRRLAQLTSDLLDLRRLDEGLFTLNLVPVDLVSVANDTAAALTAPPVAVHVHGVESLVVIADVDRVRQVLENLVANAVKYSPPDRSVRIRVYPNEHPNGPRGVVEVIDEGPGIDPEVLPTLFERYVATRNSPGLGLGLYLAHRIARVHGGELSVISRSGVGTTFRLVLPIEMN